MVVGLVVAPVEGFFVALTGGLLVVAYLSYVQIRRPGPSTISSSVPFLRGLQRTGAGEG